MDFHFKVLCFRVGKLEEEDEDESDDAEEDVPRVDEVNEDAEGSTISTIASSRLKEGKLVWSQFKGLFAKRVLYTKRRWLLYTVMVLFEPRIRPSFFSSTPSLPFRH